MKVSILGCGLRTPLLLHRLIHSDLTVSEISLYDIDPGRSHLMMEMGAALALASQTRITETALAEKAIEGSSFVVSSIRVGNMQTRAVDERLSLEWGLAGQETTGPAGFAMALRTIPVAIEHARLVERLAPEAWILNFTNPAGMITQAISTETSARVVGICDTPAELSQQIARALGEPVEDVECEYFGLNHLGWVRSVYLRGEEVTDRMFQDDRLLNELYPAALFSPSFLRALGLIPSEYLFYYYERQRAVENQRRAGATRGEELRTLDRQLLKDLETLVQSGDVHGALGAYRRYLNRRSISYMRLDGAGESAFRVTAPEWDPFEGATGYHRIAVDAMRALTTPSEQTMVLNVPNRGCFPELSSEDIVELPCAIDEWGPYPLPARPLPEAVRGLVVAVKQFERLTIRAALQNDWDKVVLALASNPIVGNWDVAQRYLRQLASRDTQRFFRKYGSFTDHAVA